MKNNFMKKEKGITLIALIVTIIVLLILAGVSIAVLTGENGLLNRATSAKQTNEQKTAEEELKLGVSALSIDYRKNATNAQTFKQFVTANNGEKLKDAMGLTGDDRNQLTANSETGIVTYKGVTYQVTDDGKIGEATPVTITLDANGGTIESNARKTYSKFPGETISSLPEPAAPDANHTFGGWYDNSQFTGSAVTAITASDSNQTYYAKWTQSGYGAIGTEVHLNNGNAIAVPVGSQTTIEDKWYVFYEDASKVYLIYGDYYPVNVQDNTDLTIVFGGNKTYAVLDGENRTNLLRYLRNDKGYSWDSTKEEDVNGTGSNNTYASWDNLKNALSGLTSLSGKTIKVQGSPDIELWNNSWVATGNTPVLYSSNKTNANGYLINGSTSAYSGNQQPGYTNSTLSAMYFPAKTEQATANGYRLASPGARGDIRACYVFYDGLVRCDAYYYSANFCARPVVSIAKP